MSGSADRRAQVEVPGGWGVQVGNHNTQNNYFFGESAAGSGAGPGPTVVVVGDVPQEPVAFQLRPGQMEALEGQSRDRVRVVFAVTGIRGVGKTQVAASYARRRIAEGWRMVAWVDANGEASLLGGLTLVAVAAGVGSSGEDARVLAARVRSWLESDGERRLLVFDNVDDLDMLRPFIPASGAAQVIVTSSRRSAAGLGVPVPVDVFSEGEALAFLAERTGLDDVAGARELAAELGFLPLGLAQAAALVAKEHLSFGIYLGRLRALPVAGYVRRAEGDAYPHRLGEAITLSLSAVEAGDTSGVCGRLMGLVAVLAETGVPRRMLYRAADTGALGDGRVDAAEVDAGVGDLADGSLLGFTVDDESVLAHRLVMRVARERLSADRALPAVLDGAVRVLAGLAGEITEAWRDPAGVRDLAGQVSAVLDCLAAYPEDFENEPAGLTALRLRSVYLLNTLGDSTGLALAAALQLVADFDRMLDADHPDTLSAYANLAYAYRSAGQLEEAIPVFEQARAGFERVLGADHPNALASRANLAGAYQAAGRIAEAIPLLERALADSKRVHGADHPNTLMSRNNLAGAYQDAGRTAEAIPLHEQTLADRERVLGPDHPETLTTRNNLAGAYLDTGRTSEALALYERTLADRERVLGADHPETMKSRNNLATAYRETGRTAEAIPLFERALADLERVLGAAHPDTFTSRSNLAAAYLAAGRTAEAIPLLEQTLADRERVRGAAHPDTFASRSNLAAAYQKTGRTPEAIPLLEHALADSERVLGADHPITQLVRKNLAAVTG